MNEVVKKESAPLAVPAQVSEELRSAISEVKENLESIEKFQLPKIKVGPGGMELREGEPLLAEVTGTIIHTRRVNQYYKEVYDPNKAAPPDCFSLNGKTPDPSVEKPVHKTCDGCPMAEFGTNNRKSGKACRNLKPIYLVMDGGLMPRQITVPPTSIKAANNYLMDLTAEGINYRKIRTKITAYKENAKDTYSKLKFSPLDRLDAQKAIDMDFLKQSWLPVMDAQQAEIYEEKAAEEKTMPADAKGEF